MSRVLVTGGPGFIGRRVVARFSDAGWDVTSFSLPTDPLPAEWGRRVAVRLGDLADAAAVAAAAHGADVVIHLAAPVGVAGRYAWHWDAIVCGTAHVCRAAAQAGARTVVASSIAVYGTHIQTQVCHEDLGHGPWAGAYGWAKQGQETIARVIAGETGMPLTVIRPANVYGLGGGGAWGDRLLTLLTESGGAVFGDAETNAAGLVHVDNLADAVFLAATLPAAIGRCYNVCDENGATWRRFMDDMAELADRPPPPHVPLGAILPAIAANEDPAHFCGPRDPAVPALEGLNLVGFDNRIDSTRIRRELGWAPAVDYAAGFAAMRQMLASANGIGY